MAIEDELRDSLERLNNNITRVFGGTESFRGARTDANVAGFQKGVRAMTESFRVLHGTTDEFGYALKHAISNFSRILGLGALAEIAHLAIDSGRDLVRTYNKLSDVGQMFGGSMFSMAQLAGQSGLSLEEFAKAVERNSTVAAVLGDKQQSGIEAFADLQKGVRNNLQEFGFYGMTLSQVSDATFDYMETLRESGTLTKMDRNAQIKAATDLITETNELAQATGKSREEILKITNSVLRTADVAFVTRSMTNEQRQAFTQFTAELAALPGEAGQQLSKGLGDLVVMGSSAFTEMGNEFRSIGLEPINGLMEGMRQKIDAGIVPSNDEIFDFIDNFNSIINANSKRITDFLKDPSMRAATQQAMAFANAMAGLSRDKLEAERKKQMDPITKAALLFESKLHEVTGAFRDAFYGNMLQTMGRGTVDLSVTMKNLENGMKVLGGALGNLFGEILTPENLSKIAEVMNDLSSGLASAIPVILDVLKDITGGLRWFRDELASFGMSKGWATIITGGLAILAAKFLRGFLAFRFQNAVLRVNNLFGGGGSGGGPGPVTEYDSHLRGLGAPTLRESWRAGGMKGVVGNVFRRSFGEGGMFRSFGGLVFGSILGFAADKFAEGFLDQHLPDNEYKDMISGVVSPIIGTVAGLFGPVLLKGLATATLEAIAPVLGALLAPEVFIPALIAAGLGAVIWQQSRSISKHYDAGDAYIDPANPQVMVPLDPNEKLDPRTGLPTKIKPTDDPLSQHYFDDLVRKKELEDKREPIPPDLIKDIAETLKQIRAISAHQAHLQKDTNESIQSFQPLLF